MSKKDLLLDDFIQSRIEGLSFQAIALKLKVSKQTLLEWNKQLSVKDAIVEGKFLKTNELLKAYEMDRQKRLEGMLQFRKRINDELYSRQLSDIPTHKLYEMLVNTTDKIKSEFPIALEIGNNPNVYDFNSGEGFFKYSIDE